MRTLRALALVLLAGALLPSAAQAADRPHALPGRRASAIVIEVLDGTVACATNPNEHRPIASTRS
jgi:D-alanyl-D-alanine carboxypeptidase